MLVPVLQAGRASSATGTVLRVTGERSATRSASVQGRLSVTLSLECASVLLVVGGENVEEDATEADTALIVNRNVSV